MPVSQMLTVDEVKKIVFTRTLRTMPNGVEKVLAKLKSFQELEKNYQLNLTAKNYVQNCIQECQKDLKNHGKSAAKLISCLVKECLVKEAE